MPIFELSANGKTFEIEAPDQSSALSAFQQSQSSQPDIGVANAIGRGAAQGLTLGGYDELRGLTQAGGTAPDQPASLGSVLKGAYNLITGSGGNAYEAGRNASNSDLAVAQAQYPKTTLASEVAGGLAGAIPLGAASLGTAATEAGAGMLPRIGASIIDGGVLGGAQGALSADEGSRLAGAGTGAAFGGALGAATPPLIDAGAALVRRAITPFGTNAERTAAADLLRSEGVPVTAGQATGSRGLKYAESELGGGKTSDIMEEQGRAFTDAAMRRAGGSGLATPDNLNSLQSRLGQEFSDISSRNTMAVDRKFGDDVGKTLNEYGRVLDAQQKPIINNITDDLLNRIQANGGTLPGTDYQAIRSQLSQDAQRASNPGLSGALRGLRNALDDAMERSINPADAGAWKELRRQYGNSKVLQKASVGAGEDAGLGVISPARLRSAAAAGNSSRFALGGSDYTDLAKAGQAVLSPVPNSGTAGRLRAQNLGASVVPYLVGSSAGAAYGGRQGDLTGAATGAIAGAALPRVAGSLLMSGPAQSYLRNQLLTGSASPSLKALAQLLFTNGAIASRNQ